MTKEKLSPLLIYYDLYGCLRVCLCFGISDCDDIINLDLRSFFLNRGVLAYNMDVYKKDSLISTDYVLSCRILYIEEKGLCNSE